MIELQQLVFVHSLHVVSLKTRTAVGFCFKYSFIELELVERQGQQLVFCFKYSFIELELVERQGQQLVFVLNIHSLSLN